MPSLANNLGKLGARQLTKLLSAELEKVVDILDDGTQVTNKEKLIQQVVRQAVGWTEEKRDDSGNLTKIVHAPVGWCQQFCFMQVEGKAPMAVQEETPGIRAADKVRDLAKQRMNALAKQVTAPAKPSGPPKFRKA